MRTVQFFLGSLSFPHTKVDALSIIVQYLIPSSMDDSKQQTSGLSSRIRAKPNSNDKPQEDLHQKKYTFYLDVTLSDKNQIPKIEVIIPISMKVFEAVNVALMRFKLELEPLGVFVDTNQDLYYPRLAKKNGKAKCDMPSLDADQILSEIKISGVSLQPKDSKAVICAPAASTRERQKVEQSKAIQQEIGVPKKEAREITKDVGEKPSKPESTCFFSFC